MTGKRRALLIFARAVAMQVPWLVCCLAALLFHSFFWLLITGLLLLVGSPLMVPMTALFLWPHTGSDVLGFGIAALAGVAFWFAFGLIFWFRGTGESD